MSKKGFEHDALVCHVRHVNPRIEKHGEDDVLSVDVSLRLMMAEAGSEWDPVLADIAGDFAEQISELGSIVDRLPFSAAYEEHRVNFRASTTLLASLSHAEVNKFALDYEDLGLTFRVQASEVDGETVGALSELIGTKVRVEITAMQGELELDASEAEDAELVE